MGSLSLPRTCIQPGSAGNRLTLTIIGSNTAAGLQDANQAETAAQPKSYQDGPHPTSGCKSTEYDPRTKATCLLTLVLPEQCRESVLPIPRVPGITPRTPTRTWVPHQFSRSNYQISRSSANLQATICAAPRPESVSYVASPQRIDACTTTVFSTSSSGIWTS